MSESQERVAYADVLLTAINEHEKELDRLTKRLNKELRFADALVQRLLRAEIRLQKLENKLTKMAKILEAEKEVGV